MPHCTVAVPVEEVGLVLVNLQLANTDWADLEEQHELHIADRSSDISEEGEMQSFDSPTQISEYSDGASSTPPSVGYWIGLYAIPGIDFEAVMRALHPAWGPPVPFSELICRPEGHVPSGNQTEIAAHAQRLHPMRCRNNLHLYRGMFLIVDTPNYDKDGILLVKFDWDEKALERQTTMTNEQLTALGEDAETDTQRLPFANATTITIFNEIKAGYRPWKHMHRTFFAYAGPRIKYPSAYVAAMDRSFKRRKSGAERFLEKNVQYLLSADDNAVAEAETGLQTALEQHAAFVHEARFCATLCSEYFVYCDKKLTAKDTNDLVMLVKVDGDGSWSTMNCKAGNAYQELCDIVDGNKDWQPEP